MWQMKNKGSCKIFKKIYQKEDTGNSSLKFTMWEGETKENSKYFNNLLTLKNPKLILCSSRSNCLINVLLELSKSLSVILNPNMWKPKEHNKPAVIQLCIRLTVHPVCTVGSSLYLSWWSQFITSADITRWNTYIHMFHITITSS
jgi:hypothetical protein